MASPGDVGFAGGTEYTLQSKGVSGPSDTATYAWDLGDGTQAAGETVKHVYAKAGTFRVVLTASRFGQTDQATTSVQVADFPTPSIQSAPEVGVAGLTDQTFRVQGVAVGSESSRLVYTWDFGDGEQGTGDTVHHVFQNEGTYGIGVTVAYLTLSSRATTSLNVRTVASSWTGHYQGIGNDMSLSLVRNGPAWTGYYYDWGSFRKFDVTGVQVDYPNITISFARSEFRLSGTLDRCVDDIHGFTAGPGSNSLPFELFKYPPPSPPCVR